MDGVRAALVSGRVRLGLLGLMAGLSAWLLVDVLPDRMAGLPRLHLFVTSLGAAFFPAALALSGPLPPRRALVAAGLLALPLAGLMAWASLRFDDVAGFLATGHPWIGLALLLGLALPFLIAGLGPGRRPTDYAVLFTQSWMIVVRFAAAWLFVGLVWGVLFLSNALLGLVGIDVIERLMNRAEMPYLLSGLMLGLALAVVDELSEYVSPELVLQMLRLLLPVVLVVVAVFLAALPFRGLSNLFGDFSAAAILLAMAFGSATLVSSGLDASDERWAPGGLTWWCCRLLALVLPVLAALAGVAVWLRVAQYGLTPDRVVAGAMAALALGYGLAYAGSVLAGPGWGARIRRANVGMALVAMAAQAGPRAAAGGGTVRPPDASDDARRAPAVADAGRGTLLAGLALVTVAASLRAVLGRGEELAMGGDLMRTAADVARAIAWPVLAVLTGAAVLDAIARRVAWARAAWMSRRELEEELRETEGHPLARRRRAPERRRRRHA